MSSGSISIETYDAVGITLIVISSAVVAVRCFVNYQTSRHRLGLEDYFSILGLVFLIATFAVNDVITRILTGPVQSIDLVELQKIAVVIIILVQGTLWFTKAPILLLYIKIFGINRWLRYVSWLTLGGAATVYIAGLIYTLVNCPIDPSKANFVAYQSCAHSNTLTGVISGFVSVVVDAIMFILPIPIILELKLERSKKIGLAVTFFWGILGIVASTVSLYYKWEALGGDATHFIVPIMCFTLEAIIAVIVGCAPAMKGFWSLYISKSSSVKGSQASSYKYRQSSSRSKSARQLDHSLGWEGSDEHINVGRVIVTTDFSMQTLSRESGTGK
ncbi:hypothetical protein V8F20_009516 [Naviculisporaceae sp. PSN 640]